METGEFTSIDSSGMDSFELCDAVDILRKIFSEIQSWLYPHTSQMGLNLTHHS